MNTYYFEAMDATGQEISDTVLANNEKEAQAAIRQQGYFVTKISNRNAPNPPAQPVIRLTGVFDLFRVIPTWVWVAVSFGAGFLVGAAFTTSLQ